jgi:hypothetical protein
MSPKFALLDHRLRPPAAACWPQTFALRHMRLGAWVFHGNRRYKKWPNRPRRVQLTGLVRAAGLRRIKAC